MEPGTRDMEQGIAYRKLVAWQKADELAFQIYQITKDFPSEEKFGLVSQMRRAALSVAANIAEGYTRKSKKDKVHFYNIAQGSLTEIEYYLDFSWRLGYIHENKYPELIKLRSEAGRLLAGLIKSTNAKWMSGVSFSNPVPRLLLLVSAALFFIPCLLLLVSQAAFAAQISFDTPTKQVQLGEKFALDIFVNTERENINAFEGAVTYDDRLLDLKELRDGNTIVNFWIEKPREEQGTIIFSGISPGGFRGGGGLLFTAVFEAKKAGAADFEIKNARLLLSDGAGTPAPLSIVPFEVDIPWQTSTPKPVIPPEKDLVKPESFVPEIARNELLFENKWFVVFATQDKASGVDHFEVKETRQKFFSVFQPWSRAESPYALQDQELRSFIFVKAVDREGNQRIEKLFSQHPLAWYENYENWVIMIAGIALVLIAAKILWRKKRFKKY